MDNNEILSIVFGEKATKELSKIVDYEGFPEKSQGYQLAEAAQILSKLTMSNTDKWESPFQWEADEWERLCSMSYKHRIAHALSFLTMEFKRVQSIQLQETTPNRIRIQKKLYEPLEWKDLDRIIPPIENDQNLETPEFARNIFINVEEVKADKNEK